MKSSREKGARRTLSASSSSLRSTCFPSIMDTPGLGCSPSSEESCGERRERKKEREGGRGERKRGEKRANAPELRNRLLKSTATVDGRAKRNYVFALRLRERNLRPAWHVHDPMHHDHVYKSLATHASKLRVGARALLRGTYAPRDATACARARA